MTTTREITWIGEEAQRLTEQGYCCSEAMVLAATGLFRPGTDADLARVASGLCGGMGNHSATCGVFTGGAVAIGVVCGDTPGQGGRRARELAAGFQERLAAEAGAMVCGELLERMGATNHDRHLCRALTRRGAELLAEILIADKKAVDPGHR